MKLPNFIATVRKCVEVDVKDTIERGKIHDVILLSFDQLDDATKVNLILASLNDEAIDNIMAKEKNVDTVAELDKENYAALIKWRSWVMKTVIIFAGIIIGILTLIMFTGTNNCDVDSSSSVLFEIKKLIEIIILNKTE